MTDTANPLLNLTFEPAFESLGEDYCDRVSAADFPQHILRFRNDDVLAQAIGLDPQQITDTDFIEAFGQFQAREPFLAMRYHGYQFGEYNPWLGDGRGFLYGQIRGQDGKLYDFGTKGSGMTPYSRTADGRLTLKGGVREVLAAEALHHLGVRTSRAFSLIETGESLWRGDEPSPTRSSVLVRFSHSHIRFGTFERLHAIQRPDLVQPLLDHVLKIYYPELVQQPDAYLAFYQELVRRTAELVAQWMSVGFCHAVLNTDNMSITGESFDYGPYAFINNLDLDFTAAYFDYFGRYRYSNQPGICKWNLEMLQRPLSAVMPESEMANRLEEFGSIYHAAYRRRMLAKLGFADAPDPDLDELLRLTLKFLQAVPINYHDFFTELRLHFSEQWLVDAGHILNDEPIFGQPDLLHRLDDWRQLYGKLLRQGAEGAVTGETARSSAEAIAHRLKCHNPLTVIVRPEIEAVWEPIATEDNWQPFYALIQRLQTATDLNSD